jgi:hypothetical protein
VLLQCHISHFYNRLQLGLLFIPSPRTRTTITMNLSLSFLAFLAVSSEAFQQPIYNKKNVVVSSSQRQMADQIQDYKRGLNNIESGDNGQNVCTRNGHIYICHYLPSFYKLKLTISTAVLLCFCRTRKLLTALLNLVVPHWPMPNGSTMSPS